MGAPFIFVENVILEQIAEELILVSLHGIFDFSGFLEVISRLNTPDVFHKFGGQTCNITGFKGFSLFYL